MHRRGGRSPKLHRGQALDDDDDDDLCHALSPRMISTVMFG